MTTAPKTLVVLQAKLVKNLHTKNLGIVGDDKHVQTGGYHIGAKSLRHAGMGGDYSLQFALDNKVTHDYACAIDVGGSPALLMKLGNRLVNALRAHDPRVYGKVRGVNAPFGGVSIDRRVDDENPAKTSDDNTQSSSDRGHIHIEIYRSLVLEQSVMDGLYAVLAGVPLHRPAPHPSATTVTVHHGDTLTSIAAANHVKGGWKAIQKLNRPKLNNPNKIYVGEKIRIR